MPSISSNRTLGSQPPAGWGLRFLRAKAPLPHALEGLLTLAIVFGGISTAHGQHPPAAQDPTPPSSATASAPEAGAPATAPADVDNPYRSQSPAVGYPQQGYREPTREGPLPELPNPYELGADIDETGAYYQVLKHYVRPQNAQMPGYGDQGERPEFVRLGDHGKRRHDRLYFRIGGGLGTTSNSVEADRSLPTQRDLSFTPDVFEGNAAGISANTEIALGFTPFGGVVFGVGCYTATIPALEATVSDPRTGNYVYRLSQLALFSPIVDAYIFPELGFHVQAGVGLGTFVAGVADPEQEGPRGQAHTAIGWGAMLGVGYDWWIADQWSLGLLARGLYGSMNGTDSNGVGWSHKALAPSALITATYH